MTKDERLRKREADIDAMIDRFRMMDKCGKTREELHEIINKAMICNNFAFVLADVANTFLMDCEKSLETFGIAFDKKDKYNFRQMLDHVKAARKWAEKSAMPIYEIGEETDEACADSDWWYSLIKLIDDRTGDDPQKTNMLLEYILAMPSQVGLFKITYDDFKRFKKDKNF